MLLNAQYFTYVWIKVETQDLQVLPLEKNGPLPCDSNYIKAPIVVGSAVVVLLY